MRLAIFYPNAAAVRLHDAARDGKSHTQSSNRFFRITGAKKFLEDLFA